MAWIPFDGSAKQTDRGWMLVPSEDAATEIELAGGDVEVDSRAVLVRVGAKALRIFISALSPANVRPVYGSKKACEENRSRCTGGIELCCSDEIAGPCSGHWNDCGLTPGTKNLMKSERTYETAKPMTTKV